MKELYDIRELLTGFGHEDRIPATERRLMRLIEIRDQRRALEEEEAELRAQTLGLMDEIGVEECAFESYTVRKQATKRSTISKDLLISNGVDPKIIAASTNVTESVSLVIRQRNAKG